MKTNEHFARAAVAAFATAVCALFPAAAEEAFGFGGAASSSEKDSPAAAVGARVGGKIEYEAYGFFSDFDDAQNASVLNAPIGRLDFTAKGDKAEASFKLKATKRILSESPERLIDEAYVRIFLGPVDVEGGLLKVSWGKADSLGPLDVLNPFDQSDLTVTDIRERKIAQPMLHVSAAIGTRSKAELVFLPSFQANSLAWEGTWMPLRIGEYKTLLGISDISASASEAIISFPDTDTLKYAQGGARFTTTVASVDLGAQYFYGFLPNMAVSPAAVQSYLTGVYMHTAYPVLYPNTPAPISVSYNRYHQAGLDAAADLFGFNLRAEAAANITEDLEGDDPAVYNPTAAWSLGFDRALFSGISLNLQGSGTVRLFNDKVDGNGALDLESGTDSTNTKITAILSQSLFKDTLEWKLVGICSVENGDFFIKPSVGYIVGDARIDLILGIYGGDEEGEFGQFYDAGYARLVLSYAF